MKLDTFLATTLTNQTVPHSKTSGMSLARSAVNSTYLAIKKHFEVFNGDKSIFFNFYPSKINAFCESLGSGNKPIKSLRPLLETWSQLKKRKAKTAQNDRQDHFRVSTVASCGRICDKGDHRWKGDQLSEMKKLLSSSKPSVIFVHSVYDRYWGSQLDADKTLNTNPDAWPGKNTLG